MFECNKYFWISSLISIYILEKHGRHGACFFLEHYIGIKTPWTKTNVHSCLSVFQSVYHHCILYGWFWLDHLYLNVNSNDGTFKKIGIYLPSKYVTDPSLTIMISWVNCCHISLHLFEILCSTWVQKLLIWLPPSVDPWRWRSWNPDKLWSW